MEFCDLFPELDGDTVWLYRTTQPTDDDEISMVLLLLLKPNGEEIARRLYAPGCDGWRWTDYPRDPPRFPLPANALAIDLTDRALACFHMAFLDNESEVDARALMGLA